MTRHYLIKAGLTCLISGLTITATAGVNPKVQPDALADGGQYILVNKAQSATQYMSRTSWDGALYFLGKSDSKYADYALTAVKNEDGSWSFTLPGTKDVDGVATDAPYYMWVPAGSDNVNVNNQDTQVKWIVTKSPKYDGFYQLEAGEGTGNSGCFGLKMHLNSGYQYVVISEQTNYWYPDFAGGTTKDGDENIIVNDSTSFNWGFVSPANLDNYMADMKIVSAINKFETDYCSYEGYENGFKSTLDAASALYNSETYNEEDDATILAMIDNKVALYTEIEAAKVLNVKEDAVLAAAITEAMSIFNSSNDATSLATAASSLKDAETNYSLGNGDVTALGSNMSFENLEAQGGNTTTGVAGAPTGWNVYVNGKQITTADEVKAAGIANWHGVNNDCSGDIKDGNYGFGIWTSSVPTYELSQTISGLENGTYIVKAGLMVGANGNGSRRTTQRIFANLSSTYFGSEDDYDLTQLDNNEVYGFANNTEPVTDTEMQPVEVRTYVYDGTLTFGLRTDNNIAAAKREASNGSGGDGWFKTDNYTIQKCGYDVDDAIATYKHFADIISNYNIENPAMASTVKTELEAAAKTVDDITSASTEAEITAGILSTKAIAEKVSASVKAYEKLEAALETHYDNTNTYSNKKGVNDYADFISEIQEAYDEGTVADATEVDALIAKLDSALQVCIQSDDINVGDDLTNYIQNASFEDLSAQNNMSSSGVVATPKGWNMYLNGTQVSTVADINAQGVTGWCAINEGDAINVTLEDETVVTNQYSDGTHLWGIWNGTMPEVELSQVIKGLPAGQYTLTCDVLIQYNWAGNCLTTQRIFANDYVAMYSSEDSYASNLPEDAQIAGAIDALNPEAEVKHLNYAGYFCEAPRSDYSHKVSLTFGLTDDNDAKIGFRTSNIISDGSAAQSGLGWFKLDNWTLTYDSDVVPAGASTTAEATAVEAPTSANKVAVDFYNMKGIRVAAPAKGINIVKMSDGTVSKIMVK